MIGLGPLSTVLRIETMADAPVVRAVTLRRGLSAGLNRTRASEAALVASELATNIVRYGDGGEIVLDVDLTTSVFWIVAQDRGPGLPSLEDYFEGDASCGPPRGPHSPTSPNLEAGGGPVRRLADDVRWERRAGGGSRISCRISLDREGGSAGLDTESEKPP